jgi:AcrR family transcriptional regulator
VTTAGAASEQTPDDTPTLAERKRAFVRRELAAAAARLLEESDYASITIEDITRSAGVSRRTFFRYFSSKEDVFLATLGDFGRAVEARLAARPVEESPAAALRRSLAAGLEDLPHRALELARTARSVPALEGRRLEYLAAWRPALADVLGARSGVDTATDIRPSLAAAVALAAFETAMTRWVEGNDPDRISAVLDESFALVAPAIDAMLGRTQP